MPSLPVLVILRGNSASGKSTVARRVQRALPRGRIAVVGQDPLRRDLLRERNEDPVDTIDLVELVVGRCLERGRSVVLEGIFDAPTYGPMMRRLTAAQLGPVLVYYLDVSLPETLRRHASKPLADHAGEEEVASWYRAHDLLDLAAEQVLPESRSEDELVEHLLADLAALGETAPA